MKNLTSPQRRLLSEAAADLATLQQHQSTLLQNLERTPDKSSEGYKRLYQQWQDVSNKIKVFGQPQQQPQQNIYEVYGQVAQGNKWITLRAKGADRKGLVRLVAPNYNALWEPFRATLLDPPQNPEDMVLQFRQLKADPREPTNVQKAMVDINNYKFSPIKYAQQGVHDQGREAIERQMQVKTDPYKRYR